MSKDFGLCHDRRRRVGRANIDIDRRTQIVASIHDVEVIESLDRFGESFNSRFLGCRQSDDLVQGAE